MRLRPPESANTNTGYPRIPATPKMSYRLSLVALSLFLFGPHSWVFARSESANAQSETPATGTDAPTASSRAAAAIAAIPPAKVRRYVERIMKAHDTNGDGRLQQAEWKAMQGQPSQIDANADGTITDDEFVRYVVQFAARRHIRLLSPDPQPAAAQTPLLQPISRGPVAETETKKDETKGEQSPSIADKASPDGPSADPAASAASPAEAAPREVPRARDRKFYVPASRIPKDLPSWFSTRDRDGDGQITLSEYAPAMTSTLLAEFGHYDLNGDGVITAREYLARSKGTDKAGKEAPPASSRP